MPLLETRGLTAFYGDFQALYGIDTSLEAGETIAIIGANGAGKSTFLKAIAGLIRGSADSVLLDAGPLQAGIWECTPGGWSITHRPNTEVVHILRGLARITDADGTVHELVAGAVHVFPLGWTGRWDIVETIRKVYVTVEGL